MMIREAGAIEAGGFRQILLWPLALARGSRDDGPFSVPASRQIDALAKALPHDAHGIWVELQDLSAHGDPITPDGLPERTLRRAEGAPEPDLLDEKEVALRYQEKIYFHRFVQRFLYGDAAGPEENGVRAQRIFRRMDITAVEIRLDRMPVAGAGGSARTVRLDVNRVALHLFEVGVAVLAVEVSKPADVPLDLATLLDLTDRLRRVHVPYWIDPTQRNAGTPAGPPLAGGVPDHVTWITDRASPVREAPSRREVVSQFETGMAQGVPAILPWWDALKPAALVVHGSDRRRAQLPCWRQIIDERMFVATFLVADTAAIAPGDWMRLCFADGAGSSAHLPYHDDFVADFDRKHAYDRFRHVGTRFLFAPYHFVIATGPGDFAPHLEQHFRRHYFQMALITQMQAAALLAFSNWISEAVNLHAKALDGASFARDLDTIEQDLVVFIHRFWFTGVSNQTQPQEMYRLWRQHLCLDDWHTEVLAELETSRQFLNDTIRQRQADGTKRLEHLLTITALAGVSIGLLGANFSFGHRELFDNIQISEGAKNKDLLPFIKSIVNSWETYYSAILTLTVFFIGYSILFAIEAITSNPNKFANLKMKLDSRKWVVKVASLLMIGLIVGCMIQFGSVPSR